jgi:serine/threonine-protein kinase HipA
VSVCPICLGPGAPHAECIRALYDADRPPAVDVELARLHTVALAMVGRISVSGVQRKLSVGLSADRSTLRISTDGRQFILKPQSETFPYLPQNEHVTMRMAALAGVEVPPCGLIELADGSVAYIVRRFDRPDPRPERPHKLRMEDFCQLAEKPPKDKYAGSAELCARLVRRYADEPGVELVRLLRLLAFNWWVGNGDAHLKNFALLAGLDGRHRLSPAYDLLCTRLVIPDGVVWQPTLAFRRRPPGVCCAESPMPSNRHWPSLTGRTYRTRCGTPIAGCCVSGRRCWLPCDGAAGARHP